MLPSLNEIIGILSDRVGQPFNVPLQDELKVIVNYKRVNFTQQFLEKNPDQRRFFQQSFVTDMQKIPKGDCDEIPGLTCDILRSKCKIPNPIRATYAMFDFVGAADWSVGWGETKPEYNNYNQHNPYTKNKTKWFYQNEYLYIFNDLSIKKVAIRGVFADPFSVNPCCGAGSAPCITDDTPYPVSADILNYIIKDILATELRSMFPQPGVIPVPETKNTEAPNLA
jgi:hypothetical protein